MNTLVKDKIKEQNNLITPLNLKEESLQDKVQMQRKFIEEIENQGQDSILRSKNKIQGLLNEENDLINASEGMNEELSSLEKRLETTSGARETLSKLNNLKGKISQRVSTITKEHKFFTENTVCPTCQQDIEEEFRVNRISDAQNKAKELKEGYEQLENTIKFEQERERQFIALSKEITSLTHGISQNNIKITGCQRQVRDLESEIQRITDQLANRNTEHDKLAQFKDSLRQTIEDLETKKEQVVYYDFAHSLLKDDGVKTKIIKKYLPLINQQVNRYLQLMDFFINFHLDEEFNETVKSPIHEDFSYSSFSEGEKMRIDLALLFTLSLIHI